MGNGEKIPIDKYAIINKFPTAVAVEKKYKYMNLGGFCYDNRNEIYSSQEITYSRFMRNELRLH